MYVTAIGRTKFGVSSKTIIELAHEAILDCLKDSTVSLKDIDMIYVSNSLAPYYQEQTHIAAIIASLLPNKEIPVIHIESGCTSGGVAFYQAFLSLKNFKNILVLGVEKMSSASSAVNSDFVATISDRHYDKEHGFIYPVGAALLMKHYVKQYNADSNVFSEASFISHCNGNNNPYAHFYEKKFTREMIDSSAFVCEPLRIFHCSPNSDGAVAVLISNEKKTDRDIKIIGSAIATNHTSLVMNREFLSFDSVKSAAKKAYSMANIISSNVDFAEVHDGFTIAQILAMEDLGFCKPGEAYKLIMSGETKIDGRLPINPSGGLVSNGHPIGVSGLTQIYEVVKQLRREAGKNQVKGKIGLTCNTGGFVGSAAVNIFEALK